MTLTWLGVPLCDGNRLGNLALEEVADGWRALLEVSDDRVTQRICIAKGDSANIDQLTRAWIASFAQLVDGNARADARLTPSVSTLVSPPVAIPGPPFDDTALAISTIVGMTSMMRTCWATRSGARPGALRIHGMRSAASYTKNPCVCSP